MENLFKFTQQKLFIEEYESYNNLPEKNKHICNDEDCDGFLCPDLKIDMSYLSKKNGKFTRKSKGYYLTNEEKYVKEYGNPLAMVRMERVMICLDKSEDKISLKIFNYNRTRYVASNFFKVGTNCQYLTFNHKTNSLYSGVISNYHKKRKFGRSVKQNFFYEHPLSKFRSIITNILTNSNNDPEKLLNVTDTVNNIIKIFLNSIPGIDNLELQNDDLKLFQRFLKFRGVKYPNNWDIFMGYYPQPTKKDLRKYNFKYIDTIMGMSNLNGDKIKRVLHKVKNCDFETLKFSFKFFGKNFTLSQDDEIIKKMIENSVNLYNHTNINDIQLTNKERQNAFNIFKLVLDGEIDTNTFFDHIRFYVVLNRIENLKWKSSDYDSFMNEHWEWSEKQGYYTQGTVERIYNQEFKNKVELPILGEITYFPVLLVNSKEYNKESFIQSNCVKTYSKRETSVIISLRKETIDSNERATIEYRIIYGSNGIKGLKRVQSLGRFNKSLSEEWETPLKKLDSLVNELVNDNTFTLPEINYIVGGKTYHSKLKIDLKTVYLDKNEYVLTWENPLIHLTPIINTNRRTELALQDEGFFLNF